MASFYSAKTAVKVIETAIECSKECTTLQEVATRAGVSLPSTFAIVKNAVEQGLLKATWVTRKRWKQYQPTEAWEEVKKKMERAEETNEGREKATEERIRDVESQIKALEAQLTELRRETEGKKAVLTEIRGVLGGAPKPRAQARETVN